MSLISFNFKAHRTIVNSIKHVLAIILQRTKVFTILYVLMLLYVIYLFNYLASKSAGLSASIFMIASTLIAVSLFAGIVKEILELRANIRKMLMKEVKEQEKDFFEGINEMSLRYLRRNQNNG